MDKGVLTTIPLAFDSICLCVLKGQGSKGKKRIGSKHQKKEFSPEERKLQGHTV